MKNCKLVVRISILIIGLLIGANVCALAHNFDNEVVNFTQWVMVWLIVMIVLNFSRNCAFTNVLNLFILGLVMGSGIERTLLLNVGTLLAATTITVLALLIIVLLKGRNAKREETDKE